MIGIVNYNMGNLQSVKNSLDYLNIANKFVNSPADIEGCYKLILPGVGAFGLAMEELNKLGFVEPIKKFSNAGKPILGLCLGMQLLLSSSEEYGQHQGLDLVTGKVLNFTDKVRNLPVPHVGWNDLKVTKQSSLLEGVESGESCYFVHSFYCQLQNQSETIATTDYGFEFTSMLQSNNIYGCQFHPEKSQSAGLKILANFGNL